MCGEGPPLEEGILVNVSRWNRRVRVLEVNHYPSPGNKKPVNSHPGYKANLLWAWIPPKSALCAVMHLSEMISHSLPPVFQIVCPCPALGLSSARISACVGPHILLSSMTRAHFLPPIPRTVQAPAKAYLFEHPRTQTALSLGFCSLLISCLP